MSRTDAGRYLTDSLNEMADLHVAGRAMLSHRPSQPSFWFYGLAVDLMGGEKCERNAGMRDRLNPNALAMLARIDLAEHTRWCICNDLDLIDVGNRCYACANDCHDRCTYDCAAHFGEIRFERAEVASC